MTTTTTKSEIDSILAALRLVHAKPFGRESGDPKCNAQRNLSGRTHYVDDDTLRWHKSKITSTAHLHSGLLFRVTCSDALDMHNTKRGFRTAVFDVFGTIIYRPELENAFKTTQKAIEAADSQPINLTAHYREALAEIHRRKLADANETQDALNRINGEVAQAAA